MTFFLENTFESYVNTLLLMCQVNALFKMLIFIYKSYRSVLKRNTKTEDSLLYNWLSLSMLLLYKLSLLI